MRISYTGYFSDKTICETGEKTITLGSGQIIKGIEESLVGHKNKDTFSVEVSPEKGYGSLYFPSKIIEIPAIIFQGNQPTIGQILHIGEYTGTILSKEKSKE